MAGTDLRLLGPVEAAVDGQALELGGPRQRALLALLLLEPGRRISVDRLAEELWCGAPPARADATLRSYVSRLRGALGREAIVARSGGYAAACDPEQVDAQRFERLLHAGREAARRGAAGVAAERLHAALALWRGPALADVHDGGALALEAHRLEELRLDCLEERIDADLSLGRHAELVAELATLVQEQPLRERLRRQLVLALYRCGRQVEALDAYGEARRALDEQLGLEPGGELRELERAILLHEVAAVDPAEVRHNLPAPTTSFVGRGRELAEVAALLRAHRLVTVTGMGGAGKTRLALETSRRQVAAWSDGVRLVDLTAVADPELVSAAVAEALELDERSRAALVAHARTRELLLLLDNCEHLAAACAELVDVLLRECPNVRVLATSRVPLGLPGELDYALDPLAAEAAEQLFLERAAAVRRDLVEGGHVPPVVVAICRELDGLPLAIELAAARAKALSLDDIAARLDDRFRFLRAWQRVADPRHQTLATTMDWSYGLLRAEEQALLRRLAVFAGGAELDAVAAVCFDGDADAATEQLGRLVDASLVRAEPETRMRYRLLETVRQYAAARLADDADAERVRRRHAEHFLRLADDANLALEAIGRGPQHHEPVLREQHDLRAALDWAAGADVELGVRLMVALENFWITHALAEGRRRYEQLLARADGLDVALLASAYRDYAACHDVLEDWAAARPLYERSRELFRAAGDGLAVANLDYRLGIVAVRLEGDWNAALRLWLPSLETFRREGDRVGEMQVVGDLGIRKLQTGEPEQGREMVEASIAMARKVGWHWWVTQKQLHLAIAAAERGELDEAERWLRESLPLARSMGHRQYVLLGLALAARLAAARGDAGRARALWASVEAVEDSPGRFGRFDRAAYAAAIPPGPLPAPLPLDEAVTLALT